MLEYYEIENIEQLRAIADVRRLRIIDLLQKQPMTVTQLGEMMGEAPAKMHYHVRELEKVGLLKLVETREKGGILEKYYQPVARELSVDKALLSAPSDESQAMLRALLGQITEGFLHEFRRSTEQKSEKPEQGIGISRLYMTLDEQQQFWKQVAEISKPYETPRGNEGERELFAAMLIYPESAAPETNAAQPFSAQKVRSVGTFSYNRSDLEKALAEGKRLDIEVVGICNFAGDVTADLAEQAIGHLRVVGKLNASPDVREVLMKKARTIDK
ncbi:MAG: helix-turn-helix domain-containing protein [Ktedonobacteraceae bacterium]